MDTPKLREKISITQDNKCYYCSCEMNDKRPSNKQTATLEHLMRIVDGGSDSVSNLAVACYRCNSSRNDVPPEVWKLICKKIFDIKQQSKRLKNKSKKRVKRIAKRDNLSGDEIYQMWLFRNDFVISLITKKYTEQRNDIYLEYWPEGVVV